MVNVVKYTSPMDPMGKEGPKKDGLVPRRIPPPKAVRAYVLDYEPQALASTSVSTGPAYIMLGMVIPPSVQWSFLVLVVGGIGSI